MFTAALPCFFFYFDSCVASKKVVVVYNWFLAWFWSFSLSKEISGRGKGGKLEAKSWRKRKSSWNRKIFKCIRLNSSLMCIYSIHVHSAFIVLFCVLDVPSWLFWVLPIRKNNKKIRWTFSISVKPWKYKIKFRFHCWLLSAKNSCQIKKIQQLMRKITQNFLNSPFLYEFCSHCSLAVPSLYFDRIFRKKTKFFTNKWIQPSKW